MVGRWCVPPWSTSDSATNLGDSRPVSQILAPPLHQASAPLQQGPSAHRPLRPCPSRHGPFAMDLGQHDVDPGLGQRIDGPPLLLQLHYEPDNSRAAQSGTWPWSTVIARSSDDDWESITRGGDRAIRNGIGDQLHGRSSATVARASARPGGCRSATAGYARKSDSRSA